MRNYDLRLHESVRAAIKCLGGHAPPADPRFARARRRLAAHLERLDALLQSIRFQRQFVKASAHVRGRCDELRVKHLIPIGRSGKELLAYAPGAEPAFTVPHKRASPEEMLASAARMLKLLRPRANARLFIEAEFPVTFVAELKDCAARLRALVGTPESAGRQRQADEAAYAVELRAARKEMHVVGALIVATGDDDFRDAWHRMTRVGRRRGRPKQRRPGP